MPATVVCTSFTKHSIKYVKIYYISPYIHTHNVFLYQIFVCLGKTYCEHILTTNMGNETLAHKSVLKLYLNRHLCRHSRKIYQSISKFNVNEIMCFE